MRIRACLTAGRYRPAHKKSDSPFGIAHLEIFQAFALINQGDIKKSVQLMAEHEQLNILQPALYEVPNFALLMRGTQAGDVVSMVTGLLSGIPEEIQLSLVSQCKAPDSRKIVFSNNPIADLTDKEQRMEFVNRAATQFDMLLKNPITHAQLKAAIIKIANGAGVE